MTITQEDETLLGAEAVAMLETQGRVSGRRHAVRVWYAYDHGAVWLLAHARVHGNGTDWYQNLQRHPEATLSVAGTCFRVRNERLEHVENAIEVINELLAVKYSASEPGEWYSDTQRLPVKLRVLGRA